MYKKEEGTTLLFASRKVERCDRKNEQDKQHTEVEKYTYWFKTINTHELCNEQKERMYKKKE